jgi:hypothetical protein
MLRRAYALEERGYLDPDRRGERAERPGRDFGQYRC